MTPSDSSSMLTLSQVNTGIDLISSVKTLTEPEFIHLLERTTQEFEHFLRAIEMINNEALERMLEQILEAFTLKIGEILHAERTTIFMVDEEKEQLWSKLAQGEDEASLEIRIHLNEGIAGYVATTGECLNIPDAYSHPLFNKEVDKQTGYHTRNILCMPIFNAEQKVVSVVQLLNKIGDQPFDSQDEQNFREFADSIGIILESCSSFYIAARNQRGVSALLKATSCLGQTLDLDKTLRSVMDEARDLMQADRSSLFLLDPDKGELWSKIATSDGQPLREIRIPAKKGIAGYVASTGQILNIPNAYEDPRFDPTIDKATGYHTRNILCMPVFNSEGNLIGVTQLINKHQGNFNGSDEEFMRAFNIQAGIALENAQLFASVLAEKQYQKDMLQSLSDAVISTDLEGHIVTINDAALKLLGCPIGDESNVNDRELWQQKLIGRYVWDMVPIENLKFRLEDSLATGAKHYVPEQSLTIGVAYRSSRSAGAVPNTDHSKHPETAVLAIRDPNCPNHFLAWNESAPSIRGNGSSMPLGLLHPDQVQELESSINLTVNPLTNPEGKVKGGLVVLEDISQAKRMKTTLYRYMTPSVAERAMALGDEALMKGERNEVTILFSDIRGYTTLTEDMEPASVVSLLNNYFETMVEAVFEHEGTMDKFIGDALMAVFGAPLPMANHAIAAVRSALDMRQRLKAFNQNRASDAQPQISIGIGISSGEVVSGSIGSQKKMEFTVIGDGVNLSSRLESATKEYGCDIILSEHTYKDCCDAFWVRELDRIQVKGKTEAVNIYELIGDRSQALDPSTHEFLQLYEAGRSAYTTRQFETAISHFQTAQKIRPDDQAIQVHIQRAYAYIANPQILPEDWDGVHRMKTK
ncbi:MAG: GAF domain-containing protein [Cyanothece sp. SIO1E1]|nr:GAF domain-containing protein [Cyanothece sp. SIO1E1]